VVFVRPDGRRFVRSPSDDAEGEVYASVGEDEVDEWIAHGFAVNRRDQEYELPTTTIGLVQPPAGIEIRRADAVDEDGLRELDDALRQDVPGTDGWRWEAADFRDETFASPHFDPAVYLVAVDGTRYVGIVRVWMRPEGPKLGFIGVSRSHRRRGIARALLSPAFGELVSRGLESVTTAIDETNAASRGLLEGLGARSVGCSVELVRRA
jgi:ribosomal protein S18 acetylase RimI-like enzyme